MTENFFNNAPSNASFFESSPDPENGKLDIIKTAEDQIRLLIKNSFENDALSKQIKFYAVCLRKLENTKSNHKGLIRIKARIPELHYMLPIPKDKDDLAAISLYPTFVAYENSFSKTPSPKANSISPGTIITVTFGNMSNFSEPIILEIQKVAASTRSRSASAGVSTGGRGGLTTSKPEAPTEPPKDEGDGKVVFILGDSNTAARLNRMKIEQWKGKFYSKAKLVKYIKPGRSLTGGAKNKVGSIKNGWDYKGNNHPPLNNLGVATEDIAAIIIGSAGGNDAQSSPSKYKEIIDDNSNLNKRIRNVFETLKNYHDNGVLTWFIGLPYGLEDGNPQRAKNREAMDATLQKQAAAVGFPNYISVMAETKIIKLEEHAALKPGKKMRAYPGVHYTEDPWKTQYSELIYSVLPFT